MALNKANITWSCKQIAKMAGNDTFRFDNIIQRSYVWEQSRKSNLIHSIIEGYPIPPFYARKVDGRVYDFLDGKQRINAIRGFMDNEYYLTDVPEITYIDSEGVEHELSLEGLYYDKLPEEVQDTIKDYHVTIYYYEDITPEQVRMLFAKLNNGKPLSTKDRNIANCVDIATVSDIGKHELFTHMMTEKSLEARKQLPVVMKVWMMLNHDIDDVSFMSKDFNEVMKETTMSDDERKEVVNILDKMLAIYDELENNSNAKAAKAVRKKMLSETHMVSLVPFIKEAIDHDVSDKLMSDFMMYLFNGEVIVSSKYSEACKGGSAKNTNIRARNEEIEIAWERFFSEDREQDDDAATDTGTEIVNIGKHEDVSDEFMNEPEEVEE